MADDDVKVKIGADDSGLESGLNSATSKIRSALQGMDDKMTSSMAVGAALGGFIGGALTEAFSKLGDIMRSTVTDTAAMRNEAEELGRKLGVTATAANDIAAAMGNIYVSTDDYTAAAKGMEKILSTNEASLKKLGLTTRDANGELRPLNALMIDGIAIVNNHKAGIDRNITATQIFGKTIEDGSRLLDYNAETMANATAENERYGTVVGVEAVDDLNKFKAAQDDVGDSLDGMKNAIGNALLPVLTIFSQWFADVAPAAILILKGAIGGIVAVFWGLKLAAEIVWNGIAGSIEVVTAQIMRFAYTSKAALTGDFSGAIAAWKDGTQQIESIAQKRYDNITNAAADTQEKLRRLFDNQTAITPSGEGGLSATVKPPKKDKAEKEHSIMPTLQAELDARIVAEVGYFKDSLQLEADFWAAKLALGGMNAKDTGLVAHKVFEANKKLAIQGLAEEISSLKRQSEMQLQAGEERVRLAHAVAVKIGAAYGLESKEYTNAMRDVQDAMIDLQNQHIKLSDMAIAKERELSLVSVELKAAESGQKRALGTMSALDEIDALMKLEEKKFEIESKAAIESAMLIHDDVVAQKAAYDEIELDAAKHDANMSKMRIKRELEEKKSITNIAGGIQSAMQRAFTGVLSGTMTLSGAMKGLFKGMFDSIIGELARFAAEWIMQKTMLMLFGKATAQSEISLAAGKAGANGVASFAAAPWPIDMGAPAFGAAMSAAAGSYAALSAESGFDIPAGVNPLVQTHQKEMILPAEHAETIRSMAGGKGAGGMTVNISAVDAAGVKKLFMTHGASMADSLKAQARNFKVTKK
jgi:hypothetical protein